MPLRHPTTQGERDAIRIVTMPCPDDPPSVRSIAFGIVAGMGGRSFRHLRLVPDRSAPRALVIPFPPLRPRPVWTRPSGDAA